MDYEIIVIGSGPGGYHAAIRAAQLGKKTAVVEMEYIGGVCLNVGCIPTKALLHAAADLREAQQAAHYGITFGKPDIDLKALEAWKSSVVSKHTSGVEMLLKGNKVDVIRGKATFTDKNTIKVNDKSVTADTFIVATGSEPIVIPGFEPDGQKIVDSAGALLISEIPKRFLAIGGSAIGLEFADIYNALGSDVTVVELMDHIVPTADQDVAKELAKALAKRGITLKTKTKAASVKKTKSGLDVTLEDAAGKQDKLTVDKILVAVGRKPRGTNLGLEQLGVKVERGFLPTNEHMQTAIPNIYAIGDVTKPPLLAHKAMKEGIVAAEHAAGQPSASDTIVPSVIYTSPELASVGMTEKEASDAGYDVRVGTFPMSASGRATILGASEGLVKLVGDAKTDLLLGFQMVGPGAGDMVAEATLAIEMGATLEDLALTQHPHPTVSEAIMEAAEAAHGEAIHIANKPAARRR